MAAKEQNFEMESKLKSDRLKPESMTSPAEKTQKNYKSPTKREIQDDMRKAWNKLQTNSKNSDESTKEQNKNSSVKSAASEGSDKNSDESKMDASDAPTCKTQNFRKVTGNKTTSQLPRRVHNSFPSKPSPSFPSMQNNTCIFIVNGKITAADQLVGRSAGRNAANVPGKRHSFHGGEKMVYTKRGLERAKTVPAVNIESSDTKTGKDDPSTNVPDKETPMDTQLSQINAPFQPHNAFPVHRLGSGYTVSSQAHRQSSRYLPGSVSSAVTLATHPHYHYAQHLNHHGNRHQSLRRSRPHHHHQRSLTAPQPQGREQSPLPFPPAPQTSKGDKGSSTSAKAVAWQDPPATVLPSSGPSRSIRNRQRELPNIKGFVGYM